MNESDRATASRWLLEGLGAEGPYPEIASKLSLFGQFVGDWEITEWRQMDPEGHWSTDRGELHWRWILGGRAVQDVWSTFDPAAGRMQPLGTTLRFYDASIDAWRSLWISPVNRVARPFVGRQVGSEIVLEGRNARDVPIRWIFSDITPDSFRWRAEEQQAAAWEWIMDEEMRIRRTRATGERPRPPSPAASR
jgi:hypothetical protein